MENLESVRRRIDVAEEVQSIVRTMKSLAAVGIKQYEAAVESLGDYNRTLQLGFQVLLRDAEMPLGEPRADSQRFGAIVFGSDHGMCGRFNEDIADYTTNYLRHLTGSNDHWSVLTVGTRMQGLLEEADLTITATADRPGSLAGVKPFVQKLLAQVDSWRTEHDFDHVFAFYNKRLSASSFKPTHLRILPPDLHTLSKPEQDEPGFRTLATFTMEREALFHALIRQYLFAVLFRACAESLAGENASRIAAMQAAEKSITDRLTELHSRFNQMRQTAITEEILDIITGFEAITRGKRRLGTQSSCITPLPVRSTATSVSEANEE